MREVNSSRNTVVSGPWGDMICVEAPSGVRDPSPLPIQVPQPWELSEDLGLVSRFTACGALSRSVNVLEVERFEARELRQAGQVETGQADGIALQLETFQLLKKGRKRGPCDRSKLRWKVPHHAHTGPLKLLVREPGGQIKGTSRLAAMC